MAKFRVYKGHDAYVMYSADIEADSFEDVNERMSWKVNRNEVEWTKTGDVDAFDDSTFFPDMTETVEEIVARFEENIKNLPKLIMPGEELMELLRGGDHDQMIQVTPAQRDTILAALRLWQSLLDGHTAVFKERHQMLMDIATNGATHELVTSAEIDKLCEAINV